MLSVELGVGVNEHIGGEAGGGVVYLGDDTIVVRISASLWVGRGESWGRECREVAESWYEEGKIKETGEKAMESCGKVGLVKAK